MAFDTDHDLDIAIIGAGIAGLYSAYRLSRAHARQRIGLFEASGRLGGRIFTYALHGASLPAELGAASFSDAHENLSGLIAALGLERCELDFAPAHYYLRARRLNDFSDAARVPYTLCAVEQDKDPRRLLLEALMSVAPDLSRLWPFAPDAEPAKTAAYLRGLVIDGIPLWRWPLWPLLARSLSHEAYACITGAFGASTCLGNINACDAIWLLLFEAQPGQRHFRVKDGFGALCAALEDDIAGRIALHRQRRLVRLERAGDGFCLAFAKGDGEEEVMARQVILALGKQALQRVCTKTPSLARFEHDLEAVAAIPACKLFLAGAAPQAKSARPGARERIEASYTDLPLRQSYRYSGHGLVMAMFADGEDAHYWSGLASRQCAQGQSEPSELHPGPLLVERARMQLRDLYGEDLVGETPEAAFIDWNCAPFGGAWHAWRPGVESSKARQALRQPDPASALFVCGEAYAQTQGWIEGAINNAEMMLERHFGLPRPSWVRPHYPFEI